MIAFCVVYNFLFACLYICVHLCLHIDMYVYTLLIIWIFPKELVSGEDENLHRRNVNTKNKVLCWIWEIVYRVLSVFQFVICLRVRRLKLISSFSISFLVFENSSFSSFYFFITHKVAKPRVENKKSKRKAQLIRLTLVPKRSPLTLCWYLFIQ